MTTSAIKHLRWIQSASIPKAARHLSQVVNSHNEWDPLEEIIVGRLDDPKIPPLTQDVKGVKPKEKWSFFEKNGGKSFPSDIATKAKVEVENLCCILESEGIKVRRPDKVITEKGFSTPQFSSPINYGNAMPRDILLVIGNKLIEAPMAWRCRYFEFESYRTLIKEYYKQGAEWIVAPKPLMSDDMYAQDFPFDDDATAMEWIKAGKFITTEADPCFDAAEFLRCGTDIFVQRSHVTNYGGIEWVQRQLGDTYKVHTLTFPTSRNAMHIDASMLVPKPGIVVFNPEWKCTSLDIFEKAGWKVMYAPKPATPASHPMWMSSGWLSMNTLMLDTERVVVEAQEYATQKFFESIGLKCIKVPFRNAYSFGGGIHCYTSDIRRRGELQSYF